ncbi:Ig-like domain-containing protein, partial [Phenylobacterium sp.]|uniref:Ig-like domain-containing protein n=1 Tax=Phenylobacterium sp. TaxID=1871053 RepID=UPI002F94A3F3
DNKLAFNPGADFDHLALGVSETVTLTYTMQDEHGAQSSSTVTLTVTGANDGPVAVADASAAVEDGSAVTINVLANDTDADAGDSKTLVSVDTTGAVGSVTANPDGTVSYNPGGAFQNLAQGQTTTDTFTYTMRDAAGAVSTATVTVTIMGTNDAPKVTGAVTGAALEGGASVTLNAIANASDVDTGAVLGVVNVPAALPAGVTYDGATKSFTLNPANSAYDSLAVGETRTVTVSYGVTDGIATTPASVSWTVTGANDAPVVQPAQSANLLTNGDFSAGATGWSNAGSGGAIEVLSAGTYGVTGMSGNVLELDANTGGGADDVSQTVATQPGTAYLLSFDTAARSGVPASSNSFQVLFNGQVIATLSPSSTAAQHYSFEVVSSGSTGKVEFREVGTNDSLGGIIDNVSLQATGFSEASGQTGSSAVDSFAQTLAFTDVDLSDTHTVTVGAPSVTYSAGAAPAGLAAALATAMAVSLTESAGAGRVSATFAATDSTFDFLAAGEKLTVTYNVTVIDNHGGSSTQPVTVVVTGTNDKPIVSGPVSGSAAEGGAAVTLNALANASDVDHAAVLSVVNVPATLPAGVTYDATTKSFTLNPTDPAYNQLAAGVSQTVSVTYGVSDGTATTPATATWTITGTNDAPVITGRLIGDTVEGGPSLAFNALSNASDPDGDPLSVVVFSSPLPAGVSYNPATNTFSFDPTHIAYNSLSQSEATTVSVQYGVSDGAAVTGGAVTWTLRGTNDNPIAQADSRSTSEDASITINVLANDSDPDNLDTVTLSSVQSTSARGAAVTIVNGQVVYNPTGSAQLQALNNGQSVVDTFTYTVTDSYGGTATQTVNVTVNGVTDFGAANDTAATGEDNRIYIDVLGNDTGAGLTVIGLNGGGTTGTSAQGAVIQVANNQVFYNPQNAAALQALNDGQSLTDTFTYTVRDSSGNTSTATVTVTVAGNSGGIVNSGITATMGFNSAANGSAPLSHTEGGMTVQSFYDPSAGPHVHFGNYGGDATMDLMNHNGCCSTPYEFRYFNPDNADTTFSVNGFQNIVGTGTWITSKGSLVISQIGYVDLSNNPIFQDIEWLRWDTSSSQNAIDNFSFDA